MCIDYLNTLMDKDKKDLSKGEISKIYREINEFNRYMLNFVVKYNKSMNKSRDYGTGRNLSILEAHIISDISKNPGITAAKLAKNWDRTPAAISQVISKLESENMIIRKVDNTNRKCYNLYLTTKGDKIDYINKKEDVNLCVNILKELLKIFNPEDLELCTNIVRKASEFIDEEFEKE